MFREVLEKYSCLNSQDKWEKMKESFRQCAKDFSKRCSNEDNIAISQLSEFVNNCEAQFESLTQQQCDQLATSKAELDELLQKRTRGVLFRSKAKWYMEGEKNTKYFMSLEKARYNAKTCTQIIDNDRTITKPDDIMNVQQEFYQELYTSDQSVKFELRDKVAEKAMPDTPATEEQQFSLEELKQATKDLRNGSCPGSDGIPVEVYKVFWGFIEKPFYEAIKESYDHSKMYPSARKGIINLIPKKGKDVRFLKNLRPITPLNCDYQIVEKAMSNRMMPALEYLISEDQRGFIPNRQIVANIRRILDVMKMLEDEHKPGLIISCDFLKCYDRVETQGVLKAMEFFGFSTMLRRWVTTLYQDFTVRIQNNGFFSAPVKVTRSVHQGGPASNALFLVVAELIALELKTDSEISGITVKEIWNLLNQYADDMDVFSAYDQEEFSKILQHLDNFQHNTGFKLSYEKTTVYRVGSLKNSDARLYSQKPISWTSDTIKVLGVDIYHDSAKLCEVNYEQLIRKTQEILNSWANRSLSLCGKIQVVNTLVASLCL